MPRGVNRPPLLARDFLADALPIPRVLATAFAVYVSAHR